VKATLAATAGRVTARALFALFVVLTLVLSGADRDPASAQETPSRAVARDVAVGEILVKFEPGTTRSSMAEAHRRNGGTVKEAVAEIGVQVVAVERGRERSSIAAYERTPNVRFAEPNGLYRAADHGKPDDPRVDQQWQYDNTGQTGGTRGADIHAFGAWHATSGSGTVPIAVLDSGIRQTHEDLQGKIARSVNFSASATTDDLFGHGTHVAGSAAASSNNGVGVAGTCKDCPLLNVKVLGDDGGGDWAGIANGITWATDNGAKVINMSLGGTSPSLTVEEAVNYAWGKGAVLVAAAGNRGVSDPYYPAYYPNVIAVAATDHNDQKANFSNHGSSWVDVASPGVGILSTTVDGGYGAKDGTSMAAPHAAGVVGLVWSFSPVGATAQEIRDDVEATADPIDGTGAYWSKGRINACKALGATCTRDLTPPTVVGVTPTSGSTGVVLGADVKATFSESMQPTTLTTSTVTLVASGTATPVPATVIYDGANRTVALNPASTLNKRTKYTATVKGGISGAKDSAGNPLALDEVWSFTTGLK
jgi:thermitase